MADIEHQHDTAVVPGGGGAYAPNDTQAQQRPAPGADFSPFSWIKTPKGILRLFEVFWALISFATMVNVSFYDGRSQYKFQVAIGVLVFIYTLTLIFMYIARRTLERYCLFMPVYELVMDGVFVLLLLIASAVAAGACNASRDLGDSGDTYTECSSEYFETKDKNNLKASIAFGFINLFFFCASVFFSYKENAAEERASK